MGTLYLAGRQPGAGATAIAVALATLWGREGKRVVVIKPAALAANGDAAFFSRAFGFSGEAPSEAPLLIPAHADKDALATLIKQAADRVQAVADAADVVIVEGLPYADATDEPVAASPALAERLGARVVGVAPYDRSLNTTHARNWRNAYASSLAGVVINRRTRYGEHEARTRIAPAFEDEGVPVFGVLPEDRRLLAPTVRQVAELLDGTFFAGIAGQEELVEHFLIGGLITEWGGTYFDRLPNQAVLVRGGRSDIQMAALNFPLNCLLLTGCEAPPQYVHERATDLDVPLVTIPHDTPAATALLEGLDARLTLEHPAKIAALAELASEALDLRSVADAVGLPVA
jgi:BioD-like phosphotransacetylase family protein